MVQRAFPAAPPYLALVFGVPILVGVLAWIAHHFHWIMPWYYLLPSLLFLLTFTVMPIGLTIFLAFTDYAGNRNTQLNPTTETTIVQAAGTQVETADLTSLRCEVLFEGCLGVRVRLYTAGTLEVQGVNLENNVLTVSPAPPEGRTVSAAELELTEFGIRAQFPVVAIDGDHLTLGRTPPGEVNLERVALEVAGEVLERRIVAIQGTTLTLDAPLPEGFTYTSLARYNDFRVVGWANFRTILGQANRALLPVFAWNLTFATLTVLINIAVGVFLAVMLNDPELRFRNLYRTLLIVPWALPAIITIQIWRGLLNYNFGAINRLLALFDLPIVDWLGDPNAAKAAVLLVNLWLSFPFMMTATLSALSAIPDELYEAARIDGASAWGSFWHVSAPLLRSALVPIALTSFALSFNNFNVIFLLTDGGPATTGGTSTARATDILISWAYNEAFRSQGGFAYGLGSAISILIFVITLAVSLINFRVTGALKEERAV
ncbi:binding-protein-dependent transport systems inner membrane component [Truepera radiovictrix DSM 17093]|uniref:Maltose/maltodextrin transport system permease protein n=2 Tax=Truepera TaxID=332248 RepID=D7CR66_TRURR|nr:binding-protein-dependent transport systems inner membrane component [Truepera radiovictrix DSM 17093]